MWKLLDVAELFEIREKAAKLREATMAGNAGPFATPFAGILRQPVGPGLDALEDPEEAEKKRKAEQEKLDNKKE